MHRAASAIVTLLFVSGLGCSGRPPRALPGEVAVSEIVTSNIGGGPTAGRDGLGEYDDWIEIQNLTDHDIDLSGLWFSDIVANPRRYQLPEEEAIVLPGSGFALIFADGETFQGGEHLPFKLSKKGEGLVVSTSTGSEVLSTEIPAMQTGESYAFVDGQFIVCPTPTPRAPNRCVDEPPIRRTYAPYDWTTPYPPRPDSAVIISEVGFGQGGFVELLNVSAAPVDLAEYNLLYGTRAVPAAVPETGTMLPLAGVVEPGTVHVVDVSNLPPERGWVRLTDPNDVSDVAPYESLPAGAILALPPGPTGLRITCSSSAASKGAVNPDCEPAAWGEQRPQFLRSMRSMNDFDALATGGKERAAVARSVKFVFDRTTNELYLMDSKRWKLHFDWVWELIEGNEPLDLCDPDQRRTHGSEWGRFSQANYNVGEARRYFLGTLLHYPEADLLTLEFAAGDEIDGALMKKAFFTVARKVSMAMSLSIRPTTIGQEQRVLDVEGEVPLTPIDTPFESVRFQALNPAVGFGVLQRVRVEDLETAPVSFQSIVILDAIPADVPLLGGTITEKFQTPLAHVNVLAQNRGTPNMALRDAGTDPRLQPLLGQLVRLEVEQNGFQIRVATSSEAEAFWESRQQARPRFEPLADLAPTEIINLSRATFFDTPRIGAKAAQFAELMNLNWLQWAEGVGGACGLTSMQAKLPVPRPAFAIPFSRYARHLESAGIPSDLDALLEDEVFLNNPAVRREALAGLRDRIRAAPVDPAFLATLEAHVAEHFGTARVRFRSSTNVEDLAGFNGAGLYASASAQASSTVRPIEDALRTVWASAWSFRAFEERTLFNVEQKAVHMGVLVHRGFPGEEANGVAITTNVINPDSFGDYLNAQVGEISVVNPPEGLLPEQLIYKEFAPPEIVVLARSTVTAGAPVLQESELHRLRCALRAAHNRFRTHYTDIPPNQFAIDVEFKIDGVDRALFLKQARPYVVPPAVDTCAD